MTNIPLSDKSDSATLAAAEGQAALGVGDTALARQKFAEAGAILERDMKAHDGGSDKQLLRFLAATQYYKGGHYQRAEELAAKIEARVLPKNVRGLLPQFLKDVKERASSGYATGIRQALFHLLQQKQPAGLLAVLQQHPYVLPQWGLAYLRATQCQQLRNYRAAALFYAAALRSAPASVGLIFLTAADPLRLPSQGQLDDAWEYVRYQVELFPHPVTYISALLVACHRTLVGSPDEKKELSAKQLEYLDAAREAYQRLPSAERDHPDMRAYMAFGLEAAAMTWALQGNKQRGKEAWDQAIRLGANASSPWVTRAFATGPSEPAGQTVEMEYLSERENLFLERFAHESAIWQRMETLGV